MNRLALVLVLVAGGCAMEGDDDAPGGAGGKADDFTPAGDALALAPAYALRLDARFTHCTRAGNGCGAGAPTQDSVAVIGLWKPVQKGEAVTGPLTLCGASSRAGGNDLSIDPRFLRGLPPIKLSGRVGRIGDRPGLSGDVNAVVLGAKLADPLGEDVPDAPTDPRVIDHDRDGQPGFSISTGFGSIFAALRVMFRLEAAVGPGGGIAGAAELTTDQTIFGDNIPLVDARAKAAEAAETTIITGEDHTFVFVPVARATCDAAVAALPAGVVSTCEVERKPGMCIDTDEAQCGGELWRNACAGDASVMCCVP